jgi:hypothetical protein
MASILKSVEIDAPADAVWDAVADFGAVHRRFAPGFVTNVELIPGARMVTFGNGMTVKELFLDSDDQARRLAYSVRTDAFDHHSASFTVTDLGGGQSRLDWRADVLPDTVAPTVAGMVEEGIRIAQNVLGRVPA